MNWRCVPPPKTDYYDYCIDYSWQLPLQISGSFCCHRKCHYELPLPRFELVVAPFPSVTVSHLQAGMISMATARTLKTTATSLSQKE